MDKDEPNSRFIRLMAKYNWQQNDWLQFKFSLEAVLDDLLIFTEKAGRVSGIVEGLPEETKQDVVVEIILAEAIKTSEIEGEYPQQKRCPFFHQEKSGAALRYRKHQRQICRWIRVLMIDVRNTFKEGLTKEKLFEWHRMLLGENKRVVVGQWRSHEEPMQVNSGALGKEKVHYEARPSSRVPEEMKKFIQWFNDTAPGGKLEIKKAPVRSSIAPYSFPKESPLLIFLFPQIPPFQPPSRYVHICCKSRGKIQTHNETPDIAVGGFDFRKQGFF